MSHSFTLPEQAKLVGGMQPAADAAGRGSRWINAGLAEKIYFVFHLNQANAATIALTVNQASAIAGTGTKVITKNARIWANLDCAANPDNLTRQADAVSFTTDAALKEKLVVIEVDPASLDIANGFAFLQASTGASNAANITECMIYAVPVRYSAVAPGVNIAQ